MGQTLYQWIDLLWLPIALLVTHKGHRLLAMGFVLACVLTLRMQVELMDYIGHPYGFLGILATDVYIRGLIAYGAVITLFLGLAYFSRHTTRMVFLAAALSLYILAFAASMLLMLV